jgi:hypothetical protein
MTSVTVVMGSHLLVMTVSPVNRGNGALASKLTELAEPVE